MIQYDKESEEEFILCVQDRIHWNRNAEWSLWPRPREPRGGPGPGKNAGLREMVLRWESGERLD